MHTEQIKTELKKVLAEIQGKTGRAPMAISDETRPMQDLAGFDSFNAVEASTELSAQLDCYFKPDVALFVQNGTAFSVAEIAEKLSEIFDSQKAKP